MDTHMNNRGLRAKEADGSQKMLPRRRAAAFGEISPLVPALLDESRLRTPTKPCGDPDKHPAL